MAATSTGPSTGCSRHSALSGARMALETAESRDPRPRQEPRAQRVKIEDIQRIVAKHYNVSRADILSSRRTATVVKPRQVAMYLAKTLTPRSLPEIGRLSSAALFDLFHAARSGS